jgi:ABC-type lipoprotein export system ATPase subunit
MGLDYFKKACANARKRFSILETQLKKKRKRRMEQKYLFIIMGPAGCGKSTVAKHLGEVKGWKSIEGDDVSFPTFCPIT